jgi:hypothetical protein
MLRGVPALALLWSCGADFIEPNPPRLLRARVDYQASSVAEPVVWLVIADLFLEHDADCASTLAWLGTSVRAGIPAGAPAMLELPPIQTSPCTQPNTRTIDAKAIDAALRSAEAAFPGRAVRAVLVYANNIRLALPGQIVAALDAVRQMSAARGALEPRLWAVLPAALAGGLRADRTLVWSYAGDVAIVQQIAQIAAEELPFSSDASTVSPPRQLFARGPSGVRVFKVCQTDQGVQTLGFPADGSAVSVDAAHPPEYRVTLSARRALPHAQFRPLSAGLEVEACIDHCDRYYGDEPFRWVTRPGCLPSLGPA